MRGVSRAHGAPRATFVIQPSKGLKILAEPLVKRPQAPLGPISLPSHATSFRQDGWVVPSADHDPISRRFVPAGIRIDMITEKHPIDSKR